MSHERQNIQVILTGSTGFVGEGVLLTCLEHPAITQVLSVSRRSCGVTHPKLEELIIPSLLELGELEKRVADYDACFYCAGISSAGMNEADYTRTTYEVPMHFAEVLAKQNPQMIFGHVSGAHADSTERGRVMWARVKGKTENALMRLPFRKVYNFRPGYMHPVPKQRNVKSAYKALGVLYPALKSIFPKNVSTMQDVGRAMINSVLTGYEKAVLEVTDIKTLAAQV